MTRWRPARRCRCSTTRRRSRAPPRRSTSGCARSSRRSSGRSTRRTSPPSRSWKQRRNAVVLAHNYQTPEIFHGVADFTGDSLALAQQGAKTDADVIVLAGVHFMAETAKILSPEKTVLIPDLEAGCSLAASITGADVRLLRQRYPGVPVVTYVNTSAEVKAESDICCTSANAVAVVESLGVPRVIFLPDEFLGQLRGHADRRRDHPLAAATARCTSASPARSCAPTASASAPRRSRSSPTPSARPTCSPRPTSWARPRG